MKKTLMAASLALFALLCRAGDFPVDFSKTANMGFKDEVAGDGKGGWSDQGPENDFANFDFKRKDYEGISFSVMDPTRNNGKTVMTFDSPHCKTGLSQAGFEFPGEGIDARFLYMLHTSCWNQIPGGVPVASLEAIFADGSGIQKEIKAGVDIVDWWSPGTSVNALAVVKKNNKSAEVGVFLSKFELSGKNVKIKKITLKSKKNAVWIVLGMTLSTKEVYIDDKKLVFNANEEWKPIAQCPLYVKEGGALDLSHLLEPGPAGRHGRLIVNGKGELAFEDSPEIARRFFGFNGLYLTIGKFLSAPRESRKELIGKYAEACRRQGYDMIRPLALESFLTGGTPEKGSNFDAERLDIADLLFSELKRNGIYIYLTVGYLNFKGRVIEFGDLKLLLGEAQARKLWKSFADEMMSHVNPYTGLAWKDDPAIACVEYFNEQELAYTWPQMERITTLAAGKWREWLAGKYKTPAALTEAWGEKNPSFENVEIPNYYKRSPKSDDYGLFWREQADKELKWCESVLRKAGYQGLVSQFNSSKLLGDGALRWQGVSVVSMNTYFAHPSSISPSGAICPQGSAVKAGASYWRGANSTRLAGRPFFITEHNHCFWNPYQHEEGLLFGGYSAFQGFSTILVHEDAVACVRELNRHFYVAQSPIARANEFIAAHLFKRGDVRKASHRVELRIPSAFLSKDCAANAALNSEQGKIALMTGFSVSFPDMEKANGVPEKTEHPDIVIAPSGSSSVEGSEWFTNVKDSGDKSFSLDAFVRSLRTRGMLSQANASSPDKNIFETETGEIILDANESFLKIKTPNTEGVSMKAGQSARLGRLNVARLSVPASVAVCSIDGAELASSKRMVLIFSTETANSGMELSSDRAMMRKLGSLPILLRCGKLELTLENANAEKLSFYALKLDGSRDEKLSAANKHGQLIISLDTATLKNGPTPFFELVAENN